MAASMPRLSATATLWQVPAAPPVETLRRFVAETAGLVDSRTELSTPGEWDPVRGTARGAPMPSWAWSWDTLLAKVKTLLPKSAAAADVDVSLVGTPRAPFASWLCGNASRTFRLSRRSLRRRPHR